MMNIKKYIGWAALAFSPTIHAQTTISFEDDSQYESLGVYDSWIESPFRTGELSGNVKVITNELTDENPITGTASNPSSKILAFQRSRWGGNLFGARINLTTPLLLSPTPQYAHVFIHKENAGRVMLIGLGRRTERPHQQETEQFNSLSIQKVGTGEWYDAVFPIQSAKGVEIHSLVVIPDCESPHNLDRDFVAYIDEIVINNSAEARIDTRHHPTDADTHPKPGNQVKIYRANTTDGGLNGDILQADGSPFTTQNIPLGEPHTIRVQPAPGFKLSHLIIRHGQNLEEACVTNGIIQYKEEKVPASEFIDNSYTIPAQFIDGDVRIIPYFSNSETR